MTWLIGCEESGVVRDAMLDRGIPAVSGDLPKSRSDRGEHLQVKPETKVGAARREAREKAIVFFMALLNCGLPYVALENPVGVIPGRTGKESSQRIQPHQFGADASKRTCLWLRGLPKLVPTESVAPRLVNGKKRWGNQTDSGQNRLSPGPNRARDRSATYQGIADAMADQWGHLGGAAKRPFSTKET